MTSFLCKIHDRSRYSLLWKLVLSHYLVYLSMINYINFTDLSDCQRLFHGRGHAYIGLEHINVDWYSPVLLITLYQEVELLWLMDIAKQLHHKMPNCHSVQVQYRYRSMAPTEILIGDNITDTQVSEEELNYYIIFGQVQNTGLFLDMRNGRQWVRQHAANKNVLNLFAYTCAFSVAALAGGAKKVVNFDMSKASLSKGRNNHRLNQQNCKQVIFEGVDIFKSNSRIKKHGPYELIICDPPSFQKGSVNIERDYAKLIRRIPQWATPNADIMLCLNSPALDREFLMNEVSQYCPECIYQQEIEPPEVFKETHQGKGLKVLLFKYSV